MDGRMKKRIPDTTGPGADIVPQPQESFVRQVADDSAPALQILSEQREALRTDIPAPLFVP